MLYSVFSKLLYSILVFLLLHSLSPYSFSLGQEAAQNSDDAKQLLGQLISATPAEYDSIIEDVLKETNSQSEIIALLNDVSPAKPDEELAEGWLRREASDDAGTARPYQIYLPKSVVDGDSPTAMIVHMHGAVSRPDYGKALGSPQAVGYGSMLWKTVADENNFVIVCPQGRFDCTWWSNNGVNHVRAVIRDVRRMIKVPDRSIFGSGFSDGASGCYYLAMVAPDPFAGFIALNGHPAVASSASDKQVYLRNMSVTPIFAGMTQNDSLYPSRKVLPHLTSAIANGANIHVVSYPNINHQPLYFKDQTTAIVNFVKNTKRESSNELRWLTSEVSTGQAKWLELLELGEGDNDADPLVDVNVETTPGRIRLGVEIEGAQSSDTGGLVVKRVVENSAAASAGIKGSDEIIKFNSQEVGSVQRLGQLLGAVNFGDTFSVTVRRGDQPFELSGTFPEFTPRPVYRRQNPTAYAEVRVSDDLVSIKSRHVSKLRIWLPNEMAGLGEVKLQWNGTEQSVKIQTLSAEELLTSLAYTGDRFANRFAFVVVEIE